MKTFVKLATRLSIIFEWCTKLFKQFVSLTRWITIAVVAVGFLVAAVKALLACTFTRRHALTAGGV